MTSHTNQDDLKTNWKSWTLGQVDYATLWLSSLKSQFFVDGYGSIDSFYNGMNATSHETAAFIDVHDTHAIILEAAVQKNGLNVQAGSFYSPIAEFIAPNDIKSHDDAALTAARFELILPPSVSWEDAKAKALPLVIQLPATDSLYEETLLPHHLPKIIYLCPSYFKYHFMGNEDYQDKAISP